MSLSSNARASVDPIYHNARVAEYLLLQHLETSATTPSSAR
jgi:hypothetical protein